MSPDQIDLEIEQLKQQLQIQKELDLKMIFSNIMMITLILIMR